ncbi:hypothetical protein D1007_37965 [Hordeum vulgare]|nr:hypothetical protein D1007_37965 [Hordeum vulgare]
MAAVTAALALAWPKLEEESVTITSMQRAGSDAIQSYIPAGSFTASGERIAHGFVVCYGMLEFINDYENYLEDANFLVSGSIVPFGEHRAYVAVIPSEYPVEVFSCDELLSSDECRPLEQL